eukprot:TRINITY_DN30944_c0_g1_i1.p1 TRINITY_DN30944_c0_g1~~TRINITY_DN30944_c0_g1_i1.p1  ORF type:complete len:451 (+),score=35.11 TRINITY_DN30944_c0_g1_i1:150-1355(+)
MPFAYGLIVVFNGLALFWIRGFPNDEASADHADRSWSQPLKAYLFMLSVLCPCTFPALFNSILDCYPHPPDCFLLAKPYLPLLSTLLTSTVLPAQVRRIARTTNVPVERLMMLHGLAMWVLPCGVLMALSQDCYGLWWRYLPQCQEARDWSCAEDVEGHSWCTPTAQLDISFGAPEFNGTHFLDEIVLKKEDICDVRWADPQKCSTRLLEVVGMFLFMKLLLASIIPPLCLLVCMMAKSRQRLCPFLLPLGVDEEEVEGVGKLFLVLRLPCCGAIRLGCISDKFAPVEVVQRVAIWVDVSLGWGLLHPPTAFAGFLHTCVETWAFHRAALELNLQFTSTARVTKLPKGMMLFCLAMMSILWRSTALFCRGPVRLSHDTRAHSFDLVHVVTSVFVALFRRAF